jgi:hypothetical protein
MALSTVSGSMIKWTCHCRGVFAVVAWGNKPYMWFCNSGNNVFIWFNDTTISVKSKKS